MRDEQQHDDHHGEPEHEGERIPTFSNPIISGFAPDPSIVRVEDVANYVLSAGMYAIINSHHDEWVSLMPNADHDEVASGQLGHRRADLLRDALNRGQ